MNDYNIVGLFCEDIRDELRKKHTLVGVYPDSVRVSKVPGVFAKIGVYIRAQFKASYKIEALEMLVRTADGSEIEIGGFDPVEYEKALQKDTNSPYIGLVMQAVISPVPIKETGRMSAVVRLNGEEIIVASLNVQVRPEADESKTSSTSSERLASQSQRDAPASSP